jgi:hypothetical protein
MFYRCIGYSFDTELTLEEMFRKLSAASPGKWYQRENDKHGDYLWASGNGTAGVLRLTEGATKGEWTMSIEFTSDAPSAPATYEAQATTVREELIPSLGGTNIRQVEGETR